MKMCQWLSNDAKKFVTFPFRILYWKLMIDDPFPQDVQNYINLFVNNDNYMMIIASNCSFCLATVLTITSSILAKILTS